MFREFINEHVELTCVEERVRAPRACIGVAAMVSKAERCRRKVELRAYLASPSAVTRAAPVLCAVPIAAAIE